VIHQAKGLLYEGRVAIGKEFGVTLSHHYGIAHFKSIGAIIIDCINREYCKKLIVQVPGQYHPEHCHEKKEETFQVLYGELLLNLAGKEMILRPGDQVLVDRGQVHSFTTRTGVVVEEVSTTHFTNDSFYNDPKIVSDPALRKTRLEDAKHTFEQHDFTRLW
jgi:N-acetylneuraminate synthase